MGRGVDSLLITHRDPSRLPISGFQVESDPEPELSDGQIRQLAANVSRLNQFAHKCHARGVDVYFAYPPILNSPNAKAFATSFARHLEHELDFPTVHGITNIILPRECFYDTPHHLNWSGTCRRMRELARGLDHLLERNIGQSPAEHVAARDRAVRAEFAAGTVAIR